jgi:hypothetical protein
MKTANYRKHLASVKYQSSTIVAQFSKLAAYWNASGSSKNDDFESSVADLFDSLSPEIISSGGMELSTEGADFVSSLAEKIPFRVFFDFSRLVSDSIKYLTSCNLSSWPFASRIFCMVNDDSITNGCNSTAIRF